MSEYRTPILLGVGLGIALAFTVEGGGCSSHVVSEKEPLPSVKQMVESPDQLGMVTISQVVQLSPVSGESVTL